MILTPDNIIIAVYLLSMLAAAVTAYRYRKSIKGRSLSILLPFLIYVFLQELVIAIYRKSISEAYYTEIAKYFTAAYNFYKPLSAFVLGWMYSGIPFLKRYKKIILGAATAYAVIMLTACVFTSPYIANPYLLLFRNFLITFFGTLFLYGYFLLDNMAKQQYWKPELWATIGIVFFYPVSAIALTFHKYLYEYDATLYGLKIYQTIPQLMSIFMYSCFCYAFYLCQKKN